MGNIGSKAGDGTMMYMKDQARCMSWPPIATYATWVYTDTPSQSTSQVSK